MSINHFLHSFRTEFNESVFYFARESYTLDKMELQEIINSNRHHFYFFFADHEYDNIFRNCYGIPIINLKLRIYL